MKFGPRRVAPPWPLNGGWFPSSEPSQAPTERQVVLSAERPRVKSVVAVRVIGSNRPGGAAVAIPITHR
jgi:hypothetical protein